MAAFLKINLTNASALLSWQYPQTSEFTVSATEQTFVNVTAVYFNGLPLSVVLPDAMDVSPGVVMTFNNVGTSFGSNTGFFIRTKDGQILDGINPSTGLAIGSVISIYLNDNSTIAGIWNVIPFGAGMAAITSFSAKSALATIDITGGSAGQSKGVVVTPGGNLNFDLPASIGNILKLQLPTQPGYTSIGFDTEYNLTWTARSFMNGSNIKITEPEGANNNTRIDLTDQVQGLSSLQVGQLTLTGSSITAGSSSKGIIFNETTGDATLQSAYFAGNIEIAGNITAQGAFLSSLIPKGWCTFSDPVTSTNTELIIEKDGIISSVMGTNGIYTIYFTRSLPSVNYGVLVNIQMNISSATPITIPYTSTKTTSYCIVYLRDTVGNILPALEQVTVVILSKNT